MSLFRKDDAPPKFPFAVLLVGLLWAGLLALLWWARPGEGEQASDLWRFAGRFHPLAVHLPIGLLALVPVLEILGWRKSKRHLREAVPLVLWLVVLSAVAATVAGYLLMTGEGIESRLMDRHLWAGVAFTAFAIGTLALRLQRQGLLYYGALALALASLAAAGHFGGALVHGPAYLARHAPEPLKPLLMAGLVESAPPEEPMEEPSAEPGDSGPAETPIEDLVVFNAFVLPIMEAKCTECHHEGKVRGKLRLDSYDWILAGAEGASHPNVTPGDASGSELLVRVTLPQDDDDFMPPDGKDPLTAGELAVLRWWIDAGASADATVADLGPDEDLSAALLAVQASLGGDAAAALAAAAEAPGEWESLSPAERQDRLDAVMAAADHFNFSVMAISAEDDRLKINVINAAKEFGDEQLALLEPVAERVLWLDLGRSQVTDAGMRVVGKMRQLERLHLENTAVTDAGMVHLSKLPNLQYLNLYGTAVTSALFTHLSGARDLRKLYLWQTQVDPAAARAFQRSMSLEVNIGTELAAAEPEPDAEPEPEEEEAPKPEAPKPEAPKPDAPKPDAPKPDAPKPDAPKPDAPKPEAPKPEAPKPEAPKPEAPKPEAPKPEAPAA